MTSCLSNAFLFLHQEQIPFFFHFLVSSTLPSYELTVKKVKEKEFDDLLMMKNLLLLPWLIEPQI